MFGFEAVNTHHGWSMAVLGWSIVFSGLMVLSFAISQLHKFIDLLERRASREPKTVQPIPPAVVIPDRCPSDINEVAVIYQPLIDQLSQPFDLAALYEAANRKNYPHPHLTIRCLREAGILQPQGNGQFIWNH
ncbi:MAG: OadG family protein [Desulfobacterales bacterium]